MNIRIALAALLCAFTLGDARAADGIKMPDGETCVLPGPQYVHAGALGADRHVAAKAADCGRPRQDGAGVMSGSRARRAVAARLHEAAAP